MPDSFFNERNNYGIEEGKLMVKNNIVDFFRGRINTKDINENTKHGYYVIESGELLYCPGVKYIVNEQEHLLFLNDLLKVVYYTLDEEFIDDIGLLNKLLNIPITFQKRRVSYGFMTLERLNKEYKITVYSVKEHNGICEAENIIKKLTTEQIKIELIRRVW